jgi:hypothetical protein
VWLASGHTDMRKGILVQKFIALDGDHARAEALDRGEDVVCALCPGEWCVGDEFADGGF